MLLCLINCFLDIIENINVVGVNLLYYFICLSNINRPIILFKQSLNLRKEFVK